jgi:hypothetical protein
MDVPILFSCRVALGRLFDIVNAIISAVGERTAEARGRGAEARAGSPTELDGPLPWLGAGRSQGLLS